MGPVTRMPTGAGVTLKSGNYTVTPYSVGDAHIKLTCSSDTRTSAFTISLGSGTLLWTVRTKCRKGP